MVARRFGSVSAALWLAGCSVAKLNISTPAGNEAAYAHRHPYYAEFYALSQIKKIRGYGGYPR